MRRELYRMKDEGGSCSTAMSLENGAIRVDRFDTGAAPERMLGGHYESWITIPAEELPKLAFALLAEKLEGKLGAVTDAEAICESYGLKYDRGSWS